MRRWQRLVTNTFMMLKPCLMIYFSYAGIFSRFFDSIFKKMFATHYTTVKSVESTSKKAKAFSFSENVWKNLQLTWLHAWFILSKLTSSYLKAFNIRAIHLTRCRKTTRSVNISRFVAGTRFVQILNIDGASFAAALYLKQKMPFSVLSLAFVNCNFKRIEQWHNKTKK